VLASAQDNASDSSALAQRVRAELGEALAQFGVKSLPASFGSTGFVVADKAGNAMMCGLTMERPFGAAGARRLGFSFAPAPREGPAGLAGAFLLPLLVTASKGGDVLFAGVGAGGRDSAVAVTTLALQAAGGSLPSLARAMDQVAGPEGTINAFACPQGLREGRESCTLSADPQAHGLAARGSSPGGGGKLLGIF
jgi:gamma-glutamyltranspeptidase/glutathione hydrolase